MQGKSRLIIFVAFLWVVTYLILWLVVDGTVDRLKLEGFLMFGLLPAVVVLLGWWVKLGFDKKSEK